MHKITVISAGLSTPSTTRQLAGMATAPATEPGRSGPEVTARPSGVGLSNQRTSFMDLLSDHSG